MFKSFGTGTFAFCSVCVFIEAGAPAVLFFTCERLQYPSMSNVPRFSNIYPNYFNIFGFILCLRIFFRSNWASTVKWIKPQLSSKILHYLLIYYWRENSQFQLHQVHFLWLGLLKYHVKPQSFYLNCWASKRLPPWSDTRLQTARDRQGWSDCGHQSRLFLLQTSNVQADPAAGRHFAGRLRPSPHHFLQLGANGHLLHLTMGVHRRPGHLHSQVRGDRRLPNHQ